MSEASKYPAHEAITYLGEELGRVSNKRLTDEFQSLLAQNAKYKELAEDLLEDIRIVVECGVQITSGEYPSAKNNQCHHGRFGYEGCESCTDEFLSKTLQRATAILESE